MSTTNPQSATEMLATYGAGAALYAAKAYRCTRRAPQHAFVRTALIESAGRAAVVSAMTALARHESVGEVPTDRMPAWHGAQHFALLCLQAPPGARAGKSAEGSTKMASQATGGRPSAMLVPGPNGRVMIVNDAFLDSAEYVQKDRYNRALVTEPANPIAAVAGVLGWTVTASVLRSVFVADRERLSVRRAAAFGASSWVLALAEGAMLRRMRSQLNKGHRVS